MIKRLVKYIISHLRATIVSIGAILRTPFSSFMTIAVIGIALALPSTLMVLLHNAKSLTSNWQHESIEIAVYLKPGLSKIQSEDLLRRLKINPEVSNAQYISPEEGLEQFGDAIGAKKIIKLLHNNPLPGLIIIQPVLSMNNSVELNQLLNSLKSLPETSSVQLDTAWLQKIQAIIKLSDQITLVLEILLGFGVLLIVGNTIRMLLKSDEEEIEVLQLVGATNKFIRRPFLHMGFWYGLLGGILACLITFLAISQLQKATDNLALLYNSSFYLAGLNPAQTVHLLILSCLLGIFGTRIVLISKLH
ncbi:MAG: ABC transporter permease [Gammaproteobacteria bacterium]|nr:ABC transporter permease [Gammaproteobacteria bacterium]